MRRLVWAAWAVLLAAACAREMDPVQAGPASGTSLYAVIDAADTRTGFVDGQYVWKVNDRIRALAVDGTTLDFKYSGEVTDAGARFVQTDASEVSVLYGEGGFAVYPSLAASNCILDGTVLTLNQKNNYTWAEGNVEAPMIARVEEGKPLSFTHLGGLLKVTVRNIPSSAAKLMVKTPGYATSKGMVVQGWDGKFTQDKPFVQAYEGADGLTGLPFTAGSSTDKVFYVPLPVGPGSGHAYPEIQVYLADASGAAIAGTERTAKDIRIERGTLKTMEDIVLEDGSKAPYTVTTLFGRVGTSNPVSGKKGGTADEAVLGCLRGIGWLETDKKAFILEQAQSVRLWDLDAGTLSAPYTYGDGSCVPWSGTCKDGMVYFAEKAKGMVYRFSPSSGDFTQLSAAYSGKSPMDVKFDSAGNAYVAVRDANTVYKYDGGDFSASPSLSINFGKWPLVMDFDAQGNLIVATNGCQLFKVDPSTGEKQVIAGILDAKTYDDGTPGAPLTAKFTANIYGMAIAPDGSIYLGDWYRLRKLTPGQDGYADAVVTTVAGSSQAAAGADKDGVGTAATFRQIGGLLLNADASILYVTDQGSDLVREVWLGDTSAPATPKPTLRAATYNIRIITDKDTDNQSWESRKGNVVKMVTDNAFDVVGFQESTAAQKMYLQENLADYTFFLSPEEPSMAYRTAKFNLLGQGCFWLSATPDVSSSPYPGWVDDNPGRRRICQWMKLEDKESGKRVLFMNTHLEVKSSGTTISDDVAKAIREKSAELICARAASINTEGAPVILVGDMNSMVTETTHTEWFQKHFTDAYYRSSNLGVRQGPVATYNAWSYEADQQSKWYARIDYVYYQGGLDVTRYRVAADLYDEAWPSDHWPVMTDFVWE